MRISLVAALLLVSAAPLHAHGFVGGIAADSATGMRLPCVDVVLEDTTGRAIARTQSATDCVFQFDAPARGTYRYRFSVWHHQPAIGPIENLDPSSERARMYQLAFIGDPAAPQALAGYGRFPLGFVHGPSIRIIHASDPRFEPAVTSYLQDVQLEPARRDGRPACALMLNQPFNFKIKP